MHFSIFDSIVSVAAKVSLQTLFIYLHFRFSKIGGKNKKNPKKSKVKVRLKMSYSL